MVKTKILLLGLILALMVLVAFTLQAAAQANPQTTCPVLGGNINKDFFADYLGQRIYFCCAACIPEFQKDPQKYLDKLKAQGVTPEKTPAGPAKTGK
jgi:YHS domain-containing protein